MFTTINTYYLILILPTYYLFRGKKTYLSHNKSTRTAECMTNILKKPSLLLRSNLSFTVRFTVCDLSFANPPLNFYFKFTGLFTFIYPLSKWGGFFLASQFGAEPFWHREKINSADTFLNFEFTFSFYNYKQLIIIN